MGVEGAGVFGAGLTLILGRARNGDERAKSSFGRGADIDATASQTLGNSPMAVLIEVKANRPGHWPAAR